MKKFIVLYTAQQSAESQMSDASPEAAQEGMQAWMQWASLAGDAIIDLGTPLGSGKEITGGTITDTTTGVAGYSILQAADLDGVLELLKAHPHFLTPGGGTTIQVYESLDIPGM